MEFSKILPENFFNLFQSKHRDLYIETLIKVYQRYETSPILGMPKDEARDIVEELLVDSKLKISELLDNDNEEDEEDIPDYRELANYFLRRLEQTGWITIDVNNDYVEILNFNDYAISLVFAFIDIQKDADCSLFADNFTLQNEEKQFKGYVFTIYSLLNSKTIDYGLLINQVYRNTVQFVREIRKVDHKLREFIQLIDTKDNIKELVELLSEYKDEVMDKAYFKLKTFDNINKYKLDIIKKLERMLENRDIMAIIANDYMFLSDNDADLALYTATKQINDCIDIYNSLDSIMDEIDKKNRDYISQTLTKVKYLLNDATDVAGLLNYITAFYANKCKKGKEESAYNAIKDMFVLNSFRSMADSSLSSPRGTYKKTQQNFLSKTRLDFNMFKDAFFDALKEKYNDDDVKNILEKKVKPGETKDAKLFIKMDASKDDIIEVLYIVIYAATFDEFEIEVLPDLYETDCFIITNFQITRRMD